MSYFYEEIFGIYIKEVYSISAEIMKMENFSISHILKFY